MRSIKVDGQILFNSDWTSKCIDRKAHFKFIILCILGFCANFMATENIGIIYIFGLYFRVLLGM